MKSFRRPVTPVNPLRPPVLKAGSPPKRGDDFAQRSGLAGRLRAATVAAAAVDPSYFDLSIRELRLAYEYQRKKQDGKEEQRRIKAETREETPQSPSRSTSTR